MTSLAEAAFAAVRAAELEVAVAEQRAVELTAAEQWARNPIGWINAFVWIASKFAGPRRRVQPMRITLWPDQQLTVAKWIDLDHLQATGELVFRNLVIEKSRQIGETWLFAALLLWALIYHPVQLLAMHQRAAEIADRGFTVKSLFGKMRYIYRRLPASTPGLAPLSFRPFSQDPASVVNDRNGATLYGECQRDDPGRGGTFDAIVVDEAAFVRHGEAVFAAIDEACESGIALLSSVNGSDNFHARIADEEPDGWGYLRLHWSTHPVYSRGLHVAAMPPRDGRPGFLSLQPTPEMHAAAAACALCAGAIAGLGWSARSPKAHRFPGRLTSPHYDRAVIGKTAEQVASELDIDRERSLKARVFDEFEASVHVAHEPDGSELVIEYDPGLPLELAFDYGLDCTSVIVCQDHPVEYRVIGEVELVDKPGETPTPENVSRALVEELRELGVPETFLTPDWTRRIYARGDPAGAGRSLDTGRPLTAAYRHAGFEIGKPPSYLTRTIEPSVRAVKRLLLGTPKPVVFSARCQRGIRHMRHNRWPTDALGNRRLSATVPLDDEHNHWCRAFAYLIVSKFPPTPERAGERSGEAWDDDPDDLTPRKTYGSLLQDAEPLGYDTSG